MLDLHDKFAAIATAVQTDPTPDLLQHLVEVEQEVISLFKAARRELEERCRVLAQETEDVKQEVAKGRRKTRELEIVNERLAKLAYRDELTGLHNKRSLLDQIDEAVKRSRASGDQLSLVFIDIDHFKRINDTHGHSFGDETLAHVAKLLQENTRASDSCLRSDPVCGRFGGEEFVVLLPGACAHASAVVAERLRRAIDSTTFPTAQTQPLGRLTISLGVATLVDGDDADALVKRADRALYRAKALGRNRVCSLLRRPRPTEAPSFARCADTPS